MIREKVLFFNAINRDIPSGGRRITDQVLFDLKDRFDLDIINLVPCDSDSLITKLFKFFPGIFFRVFRIEFFEYFTKLSLYYILLILKLKRFDYKYVVFNHHQTFLYSYFFKNNCYFIVHDLISLKNQKQNLISRKLSMCLENILFFNRQLVFLSSDELTVANERYRANEIHLLNFFNNPKTTFPWDGENVIIVGNFLRKENSISTLNFLKIIINKHSQLSENRKLIISVLGYKSDAIKNNFIRDINSSLDVRFIDSYNSLDDYRGSLHIAPLLFGAGVKIKVIEAYESGILTVGTKLAFQGIEDETLDRMGICIDSIEELCDYLLTESEIILKSNDSGTGNHLSRFKLNEILA